MSSLDESVEAQLAGADSVLELIGSRSGSSAGFETRLVETDLGDQELVPAAWLSRCELTEDQFLEALAALLRREQVRFSETVHSWDTSEYVRRWEIVER